MTDYSSIGRQFNTMLTQTPGLLATIGWALACYFIWFDLPSFVKVPSWLQVALITVASLWLYFHLDSPSQGFHN